MRSKFLGDIFGSWIWIFFKSLLNFFLKYFFKTIFGITLFRPQDIMMSGTELSSLTISLKLKLCWIFGVKNGGKNLNKTGRSIVWWSKVVFKDFAKLKEENI